MCSNHAFVAYLTEKFTAEQLGEFANSGAHDPDFGISCFVDVFDLYLDFEDELFEIIHSSGQSINLPEEIGEMIPKVVYTATDLAIEQMLVASEVI